MNLQRLVSLVTPVQDQDYHTFSQSSFPMIPMHLTPETALFLYSWSHMCLSPLAAERRIWDLLSHLLASVQFNSATHSCPTLCDPMDCSMPGLLVHPQLLELAQIYVHQVRDAIQPSHPLLSPSPPAFNLSQNQGLFQWVSSSHQVAKVLELHPVDCSLPGSSVHGIIQARILSG